MIPGISGIAVSVLITFGILVLLFIALRELMCWYWKINRIVLLLESINRRIAPQTAQPPAPPAAPESPAPMMPASPPTPPPALPGEPGMYVCDEFRYPSLSAALDHAVVKFGGVKRPDLQKTIDELMAKYGVGSAYETWDAEKLTRESENPNYTRPARENMKKVLSELMKKFNITIRKE